MLRVMSRLQKRHMFAALSAVGPPTTHPAYPAWCLWRAALAEVFDPRVPVEESRFLAVISYHQYLDALKAAGDFDVNTIASAKKRYEQRMTRALSVARKQIKSAPRRARVAPHRPWLAQAAGRGARAPDRDGGDPDPAWLSGACRWAAERVDDLRASIPSEVLKSHRRRIHQAIAELQTYCAFKRLPWEPIR
jgi:hypothetical protein